MELLIWVPVAALGIAALMFLLNGNFTRLTKIGDLFRSREPDVAIAVVRHGGKVLLVHRKPSEKSQFGWQFPAGAMTDSYHDAAAKAASEVLAETGVVVRVDSEIGRRRHPISRKNCIYFACSFISGEAENRDLNENIDVRWVEVGEVPAYIGKELFKKVRKWMLP